MADSEDVKILGINDFYVTEGYGEFIEKCRRHKIFPLLNIELIGISREDQQSGIRVNDPGNPGRIYISGKGLAYPSILPVNQQEKLDRIVMESNKQVEKMIDLDNQGDTDREDSGCGILYGVLQDSAYKLKKLTEEEKQKHIRKGWGSEVE